MDNDEITYAVSEKHNLKLVINHDSIVGYYLIVYPIHSDSPIADYLCDSVEEVMQEAEIKYGIKKDDWMTKSIL